MGKTGRNVRERSFSHIEEGQSRRLPGVPGSILEKSGARLSNLIEADYRREIIDSNGSWRAESRWSQWKPEILSIKPSLFSRFFARVPL